MKKSMIIGIILAIILIIAAGFFMFNKFQSEKNTNSMVLENPMKKIVESSYVNGVQASQEAIIQKGIMEFNGNFINYILLALGVGELHSFIGYGNPIVEMNLDGEIWSSEISGGLKTVKAENNGKDLAIILSKEEAVKALLSSDMIQFMKESVVNGRTRLEMVAEKPELLAKGYLDMYNKLNS